MVEPQHFPMSFKFSEPGAYITYLMLLYLPCLLYLKFISHNISFFLEKPIHFWIYQFSYIFLQKIIQKKYRGEKLSQEEKHKRDRAWKIANLLETFGNTALIVLSGYGVGADTAARILRNMIDEEDYLYKQIMTAEKQYALTRGFWDS